MMARTALLAAALAVGGCDQQMADMPRYEPYEAGTAFANGASARPRVPDTIAREDDLSPAPEEMPFTVDRSFLERGRERFDIYCSPCHSVLGDGEGMVVRRGFPAPPSFHQDALRDASDRHFYDVISNGYGTMYPYSDRVAPADRWAIVAYIRALQLSQHAHIADLPPRLATNLPGAR